jgi:hypothetical protein
MSSESFRDYLIAPDSPRLTGSRGLDPWTYAEPIKATERAQGLMTSWRGLYEEPFMGITSDGTVLEGLYSVANEGFDVRRAVSAATDLLEVLSEGEREHMRYAIDAPEWRDWYNPEFPMNANGIRLDEADNRVHEAVSGLIRACLSDNGYVKTEQVRSANLFLGELYDLRNVMNEWSFHFLFFGEPSQTAPWGWNLYGHHLAVNCFVLGQQVVISPTFMGAEPTVIDRGDGHAFELFWREAMTGIELMKSLPADQLARAVTYREMRDPAMPEDRWHFADERQLAGAYRDNRVIPYEGVSARDMSAAQHQLLRDLVASFIDLLPAPALDARMRQIEAAFDDTWFSWIGATDGVSPFYYRVQSPVILVEFDNHTGVWLTNTEPARFHVHTIVRTPNGNDYGKDLLRQHYASQHSAESA